MICLPCALYVQSLFRTVGRCIWSSLHPTSKDNDATRGFLDILRSDEIQKKLHDKKTKKLDVFKEIAKMLTLKGFFLEQPGAKLKDFERVKNKYQNLHKSYKSYIDHMSTTGEGK